MNADTCRPPRRSRSGSIVRVVNTRNHRSQVVRINDRGPYVEGRELDVSYEVARKLGFDQHGLAKVRLELLKVPSRPTHEQPTRRSAASRKLIVALDVDPPRSRQHPSLAVSRRGSGPL